MFKKTCSALIIFVLTSLMLLPGFSNVYAKDKNIPTTIFENGVSNEDKARIEKRDKLIAKYGIDKAYEMMGYKLEKEVKYTKVVTPYASDPGGGSGILIASKSVNCMWPYNPSKRMATITVRAWRQPDYNEIDFTYEVSYNYPDFVAGYSYYDDMIAANFDGADVYKYATSYSSTINGYTPATYGGGGYITDHSTYAYIIFTTKPRSGRTVYTAHGNAYMDFAKKSNDLPSGTSISVGYGFASISYTVDTFWDFHCEISW